VDLRLIIGIIPVLGGAEVLDSTDLVTRNVGQDDTLSFTLPLMTKDTYNIRVELHGAASPGSTMPGRPTAWTNSRQAIRTASSNPSNCGGTPTLTPMRFRSKLWCGNAIPQVS